MSVRRPWGIDDLIRDYVCDLPRSGPAYLALEPWQMMLSIQEILKQPESSPLPGVYFLLLGEDLQYIGTSTCMSLRIADHRQAKVIAFDRTRCLTVKLVRWRELLERAYITEYKPPHNKRRQKVTRPRA